MADEQKELKKGNEPNELEEQRPEAEAEKPLDGDQRMVKELQDKIAALESQVEVKAGMITDLEGQLARLGYDFEGAKAAYAYAVEDFKKLAAGSNTLIPAEAISGATIEEVKDSMDRALKLVASVQESLSKQAQASSIPAGAPARGGLETSTMSTKEKINYGLEQARKKRD